MPFMDCQISSISETSLPIRYGFRYFSTAATTARCLWAKVAQPTPYNPGSLVSTFTVTRLIFCGAQQITFTSLIVTLIFLLPRHFYHFLLFPAFPAGSVLRQPAILLRLYKLHSHLQGILPLFLYLSVFHFCPLEFFLPDFPRSLPALSCLLLLFPLAYGYR